MLAPEADAMDPVKLFTVIVLVSLPTVMLAATRYSICCRRRS
jgi:hypothetical protein